MRTALSHRRERRARDPLAGRDGQGAGRRRLVATAPTAGTAARVFGTLPHLDAGEDRRRCSSSPRRTTSAACRPKRCARAASTRSSSSICRTRPERREIFAIHLLQAPARSRSSSTSTGWPRPPRGLQRRRDRAGGDQRPLRRLRQRPRADRPTTSCAPCTARCPSRRPCARKSAPCVTGLVPAPARPRAGVRTYGSIARHSHLSWPRRPGARRARARARRGGRRVRLAARLPAGVARALAAGRAGPGPLEFHRRVLRGRGRAGLPALAVVAVPDGALRRRRAHPAPAHPAPSAAGPAHRLEPAPGEPAPGVRRAAAGGRVGGHAARRHRRRAGGRLDQALRGHERARSISSCCKARRARPRGSPRASPAPDRWTTLGLIFAPFAPNSSPNCSATCCRSPPWPAAGPRRAGWPGGAARAWSLHDLDDAPPAWRRLARRSGLDGLLPARCAAVVLALAAAAGAFAVGRPLSDLGLPSAANLLSTQLVPAGRRARDPDRAWCWRPMPSPPGAPAGRRPAGGPAGAPWPPPVLPPPDLTPIKAGRFVPAWAAQAGMAPPCRRMRMPRPRTRPDGSAMDGAASSPGGDGDAPPARCAGRPAVPRACGCRPAPGPPAPRNRD